MTNIVGNTADEDFVFYPQEVKVQAEIQGSYSNFGLTFNLSQADSFLKKQTTFVSDSRDAQPVEVAYTPAPGDGYEITEDGQFVQREVPLKVQVVGKVGQWERKHVIDTQLSYLPDVAKLIDYPTFEPGSLLQHIEQNVSSMVGENQVGMNSQDMWQPGSTIRYAYSDPSLTPNPNLFCKDLDLSYVQVQRDGYGAGFPAVLINERYVLQAKHVGIFPGVRLLFRRKDGQFVSAYVSAYRQIILTDEEAIDAGFHRSAPFRLEHDIAVSELNVDVTGIEPARLFGEDLQSKIQYDFQGKNDARLGSYFSNYGRIPVIIRANNPGYATYAGTHCGPVINTASPHLRILSGHLSDGWLSVAGYGFFMRDQEAEGVPFAQTSSRYGKFKFWGQEVYGGDSSSPAVVPVVQPDGLKPVLAMMHYTAAGGPIMGGRMLKYIVRAMNQMASARNAGKTYGVSTVDLQAFKSYN